MGEDNGEGITMQTATNAEILSALIRQGENIAAWRGSSDTQLANILKSLDDVSTLVRTLQRDVAELKGKHDVTREQVLRLETESSELRQRVLKIGERVARLDQASTDFDDLGKQIQDLQRMIWLAAGGLGLAAFGFPLLLEFVIGR
jgi:septal ring factor EnvC (AmiA/AmiB activator)